MTTKISRVEAIKRFFGENKPVGNKELIHLKKTDPKGFDELADGAMAELEAQGKATK